MAEPVQSNPERVRFGPFELDLANGDLWRGDEPVALAPQPLAVLRLLVEANGRTVTREELRREVWDAEMYLEFDQTLNSCMRRLRAALGDDPQRPLYVETVPKRGYRFVAPVEPVAESVSEPADPSRTPPWKRIVAALLVAAALGLMALATVGAWRLWGVPRIDLEDLTGGEVLTLAVTPFEDRTAAGDRAYLAAGVSEELAHRLRGAAPDRLRVVGASTAIALAGGTPAGGRRVVDLTLRGALVGGESENALELELLDAGGEVVWERRYGWRGSPSLERADTALRRATADLSRALLDPAPARYRAHRPAAEAQEAYLRGRYRQRQGTPEALQAAMDSYREATEQDPEFAEAWARQAELLAASGWNGGIPIPEVLAEAEAAANRALESDPESTEALLALGYLTLYYRWDLEAAEEAFVRAVASAPGEARARSGLAALLAASGRVDEAVEEARLAEELDPLDQVVQGDLCWYLLYADRFGDAVAACERAVAFEPENRWARFGLTVAHEQLDPAAALESWFDLLSGSDVPMAQWRFAEAPPSEVLNSVRVWFAERQETLAAHGQSQSLPVAAAHAAAGNSEAALRWLHRAVAERQAFAVFLAVDPRFDALHQAPRFADILRQVAG